MKCLITGVAGFIGSHLAESLLAKGWQVQGIDNFDPFYPRAEKIKNLANCQSHPSFLFREGDLRDPGFYHNLPSDFDMVIHLAAKAGVRPSIADPQAYMSCNLNATQLLLGWMQQHGLKKLVFASSSSVYGNNVKVPFAESDPVDHPISPYAFTKKACELLNHTYHALYQMDIINLRFFTVYGPRQRPDLAIRKFVQLIDQDRPIPVFGDGQTGRDYTFIADIVQGIEAAMNYLQAHQGVFEVINLGNSSPVKLLTLIDTIYEVMGKKPQLDFQPMQQGDVNFTFADISKAMQLLGYAPKTTLAQGIAAFVSWWKGNYQ